jgi:hypothetical protein
MILGYSQQVGCTSESSSTIIVLMLYKDRRRIEQQAFSGSLLGIVATNALELGVDIGSLDAVIMLGFPFGIASFVRLFRTICSSSFTDSSGAAAAIWTRWSTRTLLFIGSCCGFIRFRSTLRPAPTRAF